MLHVYISRWKRRRAFIVGACCCTCFLFSPPILAQDGGIDAGSGPTVLLDANYQWSGGLVRETLLSALRDEGFQVREREGPFDDIQLRNVDMTIIAGALAPENDSTIDVATATQEEILEEVLLRWRLPVRSAFSQSEVAILKDWVEGGGSLMVVTDHMPFPGAVLDLADAFGVRVSNGFVVDLSRLSGFGIEDVSRAGTIPFSREDGTLEVHAITNGLGEGERVHLAVSPAGSAMRLPQGAVSLLTLGPTHVSLLPEVAWQFSDSTAREPAEGWSQFGVFRSGTGRVAFIANLALLAPPEALESAGVTLPSGIDLAQIQNRQLFVNTLYWLSGQIPDR